MERRERGEKGRRGKGREEGEGREGERGGKGKGREEEWGNEVMVNAKTGMQIHTIRNGHILISRPILVLLLLNCLLWAKVRGV